MAQFHSLTIKELTKETSDSVTISFNIPENIKADFQFLAGQYITLNGTINGEEVRRDYSLCSSPESGEVKVAVKAIENGLFSQYANTQLKAGDTIKVGTPNGRFTFTPNSNTARTIAAFTAGSGITPILSITKTILNQEPNSKMVLVYGNKTVNNTIFYNELADLKSTFGERLDIQYLFSQAEENEGISGRISEDTVNLIVKDRYKDTNIDSFYLCGPEAMINTVKDTLSANGIADDKINFELFTAPTTTPTESNVEINANGESKITIVVDDETETFTLSQKKTILEGAIAEDIDAPYSCQGGVCSSCVGRVTNGSAVMTQNSILTEVEVAEGLILTCQAHATSAEITVDFDDV